LFLQLGPIGEAGSFVLELQILERLKIQCLLESPDYPLDILYRLDALDQFLRKGTETAFQQGQQPLSAFQHLPFGTPFDPSLMMPIVRYC
jgi:hypothetical protein